MQYLSKSQPDDQLGDLTAPPWAGLWILVGENLRVIVVVQADAEADLYTYENEEELREAWAEFEHTIEVVWPERED